MAATFKKKILRPGVFNVTTPKGRKVEAFSKGRLADMAKTANKMLDSGLQIAAPYAHKVTSEDGTEKIIPRPIAEGIKPNWNSGINGGFWKKFEIDEEDNSLVGVLEVPGDKDNLEDPAGKVGTTIRQTSIYSVPNWVDGLNREWKDALMHVALVNKAIEPGQENFSEITEEESSAMCISMSDEVDANEDAPSEEEDKGLAGEDAITKIIEQFNSKLGLELPQDTDHSNFLDRVLTILVSLKSEEEGDLTQQPKNSEVPSSPIVMSTDNPDNVNVGLEQKVKKAEGAVLSLVNQLKETLKGKVERLVSTGQIGRSLADTKLLPAVSEISMSLEDISEDGSIPQTPIEMSIDLLEENNVALTEDTSSTKLPEGSVVQEPKSEDGDRELSMQDVNSALDEINF